MVADAEVGGAGVGPPPDGSAHGYRRLARSRDQQPAALLNVIVKSRRPAVWGDYEVEGARFEQVRIRRHCEGDMLLRQYAEKSVIAILPAAASAGEQQHPCRTLLAHVQVLVVRAEFESRAGR